MNCGGCGRLLYAKQISCACGWRVPVQRAEPSEARPADPQDSSVVTKRAFNDRLREVNAYVASYMAKHGGTKREACLAYMKERGLLGALPPHLKG